MAGVKWRRTGLLLGAVLLLFAVFGVNALVAWFWPEQPGLLVALIGFDIAAFVAIFIISHEALDPRKK